MAVFTHDQSGTTSGHWDRLLGDQRAKAVDVGTLLAQRLVVLAAHPDDETLGAGGLIATACVAGVPVHIVVASDGEAAYPHFSSEQRRQLAHMRRTELNQAMAALGLAPTAVSFLGLPDGQLTDEVDTITHHLVEILGDARDTTLVTTWERDGHPDHQACAHAATTAAARTAAQLWQFPIWWWHWARAVEADMTPFRLADRAKLLKAAAIETFSSQIGATDSSILQPGFLSHFQTDWETYIKVQPVDLPLQQLHAVQAEPWAAHQSWYERRKRSLVLAMLDRPSYASSLEIGCSTGHLLVELAQRCDRALGIDLSADAVASATNLAHDLGLDNVLVERRVLPLEWPVGEFDLIVLSEVIYFLSPAALDQLTERVVESLAPNGTVILANWDQPIKGYVFDGADAAAVVSAQLPPAVASYADEHVRISLHTNRVADPRS